MDTVAEWVAPAATMIAAVMTAANLGARITGFGFVVFAVGSVCWTIVGTSSGQTSLVITNGFLTLVNIVGIWRWLGRQARYDSVGKAAEAAGEAATTVSVVAASKIIGRRIVDTGGADVGEAVDVILDCRSGGLLHLVMRFGGVGGIGEQLVALPAGDVRLGEAAITSRLTAPAIADLPRLDPEDWSRILARNARQNVKNAS